MRVMIVDDEAPARIRLHSLLEELQDYEVVAEASNGREALLLYKEYLPELILLDIRMPGMDGLETARHLMEFDQIPAVIFITAYDEHALQAFEANAIDYLLKPIRKERLHQALGKVKQLNRAQLVHLQEQQGDPGARTHICARARGKVQLISLQDVIYFMADQKYVTVRHRDGEVLIEEPLRALEEEFSDQFIRIHRNALVSRFCLQGMEKAEEGGFVVLLKDADQPLEISRRHVPGVRKLLKEIGG